MPINADLFLEMLPLWCLLNLRHDQECGSHFTSTLVKKRNSSPFHLQIFKQPEGVQGGHGVRWNTQPIW